MNTTLFLIIFSIAAVAAMILGLSITLIRKGHHIKSEVGDNEHMKDRGLKCASQEMREEEALLRGETLDNIAGCSTDGCAGCASVCDMNVDNKNDNKS